MTDTGTKETGGAQHESPSDEELMARLKTGEMEMLGELYTRYGGLVRAAISRAAPEISLGELDEVTHDVFIAIGDGTATYEERHKLKSWVYGVSARKARLWRRNTWLRRRLLGERKGEAVGLAAARDDRPSRSLELKQAVRQALAVLPSAQREVLLLHAVEGFSGEEIAHALGIKHQTVRTRLHRARQALLENVDADTWRAALEGEHE